MAKQTRRFEVPFDFDWTYGVEVARLKDDLDKLEKLGATTIDIEPNESFGCVGVLIKAYVNRLETNEEYKARVDEQNRRKAYVEQRELSELNRLKSKYNIK